MGVPATEEGVKEGNDDNLPLSWWSVDAAFFILLQYSPFTKNSSSSSFSLLFVTALLILIFFSTSPSSNSLSSRAR